MGEPVSLRLHVTVHQIVARQILACDPPRHGTVQRLAALGSDWHTIMHMIAGLVTEDINAAMAEHRQPDPESYARGLEQLPAGCTAPTSAHVTRAGSVTMPKGAPARIADSVRVASASDKPRGAFMTSSSVRGDAVGW
jgi:hypothetical protein